MRRLPKAAAAAERARWLAEIAAALAEAQALAWRMGALSPHPALMALYGEIEAVRAEVSSLRLGGPVEAPDEAEPEWTKDLPWIRG